MHDALNIYSYTLYVYVCVCTNVCIFLVQPMYVPGTGYVIVWFVGHFDYGILDTVVHRWI
jgi:hypothetical protein